MMAESSDGASLAIPTSVSTQGLMVGPFSERQYPNATAPDIIRSHQKDLSYIHTIHEGLIAATRDHLGVRSSHKYANGLRSASEFAYFALTTLIGNRTLGEEYCDIYQVERRSSGGRLPSLVRRLGYILSVVLVPYGLGRILPSLKAKLKQWVTGKLDSSRTKAEVSSPKENTKSIRLRLLEFLSSHVDSIFPTSGNPTALHAITLALFYFSGAYYHLSKRIWGLRYVFARKMQPSEERSGYEVLGVLLALQLSTQSYLFIRQVIQDLLQAPEQDVHVNSPEKVTNTIPSDDIPMPGLAALVPQDDRKAHYDLADPSTIPWLQAQQQRKCTLCLEAMKDPCVTTCGHVFCWTCILDWIHERPECPLCRQECLSQHILALQG